MVSDVLVKLKSEIISESNFSWTIKFDITRLQIQPSLTAQSQSEFSETPFTAQETTNISIICVHSGVKIALQFECRFISFILI